MKFCSKKLGKTDDVVENGEESKDSSAEAKTTKGKEIENTLKKGSIVLAQTKAEKEKLSWKAIGDMAGKGKKGKKSN